MEAVGWKFQGPMEYLVGFSTPNSITWSTWHGTHCCGDINEERVAVDAHDLQKRIGNDVHHFAVSPHEEAPES